MKGFGIYVKNDLLEPKHVRAMGSAVWVYLWLLDKMTSISEDGVGMVLGGRPIMFEEVQQDLGISQSAYSKAVSRLKSHGYVDAVRTPRGLVITVDKARKIFGKPQKGYSISNNVNSKSNIQYKNKTVRQNNKRAKALETVEKMKREHGLTD